MAASIPVLRTLFRDLRASRRKYYASEVIDDSGENGKGFPAVALDGLERRPSQLSDGRSGEELISEPEPVVVRRPDAVYSAHGG